MIETLKKLVSYKTITGNHNENKKALGFIKSRLKRLPVRFEEYDSKGFKSLVVATRKTFRPKVTLAAHVDVAKADKEMFTPRIKGNRLYGRGVFDMKFAIACYIKLMQEFGKKLPQLDFAVMITTDEEAGGENGTKYILQKRGCGTHSAFLPDGSEDWKLEKASKGVWCFIARSYGKSGHPSMPWLGVNALEELLDFLSAIKRNFKKEPCNDPLHIHSTIDINELNTGKTGDNLPDYAEAMIDIFFVSEKAYEESLRRIKDELKKHRGVKIETMFLKPSVRDMAGDNYSKLFSKIAYEKYGIRRKTMFTHGTSDVNFFRARNIPVIETRPKGGGQHSNQEWIDLKDLDRFYRVLVEYVKKAAANE